MDTKMLKLQNDKARQQGLTRQGKAKHFLQIMAMCAICAFFANYLQQNPVDMVFKKLQKENVQTGEHNSEEGSKLPQ